MGFAESALLFGQVALPFMLYFLAGHELTGKAGASAPRRRIEWVRRGVLLASLAIAILQWKQGRDAQEQAQAEVQSLQAQLGHVTAQADVVRQLQVVQLRVAQYLASLDEPIVSMQLRLVLDERRAFAALCPFRIAYGFYDVRKLWFQRSGDEFGLLRYVAVDDQSSRPTYRIRRTLDGNDTLDLTYVDGRPTVSELELPFYDERPRWSTVRTLHNSLVRVYLSANLVGVVKRIQLIANGVTVHDRPIEQNQWVPTEEKWVREGGMPLWLPASDERDRVRDVIGVYGGIPSPTQVFPLRLESRGTTLSGRQDVDFVSGKPLF